MDYVLLRCAWFKLKLFNCRGINSADQSCLTCLSCVNMSCQTLWFEAPNKGGVGSILRHSPAPIMSHLSRVELRGHTSLNSSLSLLYTGQIVGADEHHCTSLQSSDIALTNRHPSHFYLLSIQSRCSDFFALMQKKNSLDCHCFSPLQWQISDSLLSHEELISFHWWWSTL